MCETIINSLYPNNFWTHIPAMACVTCSDDSAHRQPESKTTDFADAHHETPIGFVFHDGSDLSCFMKPRELSVAEKIEISALLLTRLAFQLP